MRLRHERRCAAAFQSRGTACVCASVGIYSDALYQPFFCSAMAIDPRWLRIDNAVRVPVGELTVEEFVRRFEEPNLPVVITGAASHWPAATKWTFDHWKTAHGDDKFRCGAVDMVLKDFLAYCATCHDDRPLYLFDCRFGEKCPDLAEDYAVPPYFAEDLFSLLGDARPDWRWVIAGAARSGSTFHIDPNQTSAWNATIVGSKVCVCAWGADVGGWGLADAFADVFVLCALCTRRNGFCTPQSTCHRACTHPLMGHWWRPPSRSRSNSPVLTFASVLA